MIHPNRPLLDSLRYALRKMEVDSVSETPLTADLKQILRERITELEAAQEPKFVKLARLLRKLRG